ncbi:MAG: metallophosphoesterase family protein [Caulobacterales bacterium]|nr:metallophosphoesterase family protein [Caulobacterales bacterium]
MRFLVIGDVHANLTALGAVLVAVAHDQVVCVGDVIGYGPEPRACVDLVTRVAQRVVCGNHDAHLAGSLPPEKTWSSAGRWDRWTAAQLEERHRAIIGSWPEVAVCTDGSRTFQMRHNLPGTGYATTDAPTRLAEALAASPADGVVFGHSHVPFIHRIGRRWVANTGSVGQPRDGDPRAACLVIEDGEPVIRRVPYDIEATVRALEDLPLGPCYRAAWATCYRSGLVDGRRLAQAEAEDGATGFPEPVTAKTSRV